MRKYKDFISLVIVILILTNIVSPAIGQGSSTIVISSAEELIEFAENCSFDKWSRGKKVILDSDIDLESRPFEPIPIFSGIFDGQEHTIRGLLVDKEGSNFGLFRYLEKDGVIKNLKIEGAVKSRGDKKNIGGLVGYNKGKVENVRFVGQVRGKDSVGGIVGLNASNASVLDCQVKGVIYGESKVGGLVGFNAGEIINGRNESSVNTTIEEEAIQLEEISIDIINVANLTTDSMDVGGIAGYSSGRISKCENSGDIGYLSHGYNVGGIAGRQSGYMAECSNRGEIFGRKDIGGIVGQMEPHIDKALPPSKAKALQRELGPLKRDMDRMFANIKTTTGKMSESMEAISQAGERIGESLDIVLSRFERLLGNDNEDINNIEDIEKLFPDLNIDDLEALNPGEEPIFDEEYEQAREELFSSMSILFRELSVISGIMGEDMPALIDDIERVTDRIMRMMDIMLDMIDDLSSSSLGGGKIYEDVSHVDMDKENDGKVTNCINYGAIRGDINIGGIAGAMGIEYEFDPEEDFKLEERFLFAEVYQARVLIIYCENKGKITSRKNNSGGIVGNLEMGYIKSAISENLIRSTDGNYVGGIAGVSNGPIVSSYAKVELEGGSYIGGIAGLAREIQDSYSMVKILGARAYIGAIAGNVESENTIKGNFFVSEDLKGIDGISYEGKAEPIAYEELLKLKDIPEVLTAFKLDFILEDEVIKSLSFNYGDSFDESVFPKIEEREGFYGKWEEVDLENLLFDKKIIGSYIPYVSLLESEERRGELGILLVEGNFMEGDSLVVGEEKKFSLGNKRAVESWNIEIPDDGQESHTIRYYPPKAKKNYGIYIYGDRAWDRAKLKRDGKYLLFQAEGDYVNIGVFEEGISMYIYILALVIFLAIVFILLLVFLKRKKILNEK